MLVAGETGVGTPRTAAEVGFHNHKSISYVRIVTSKKATSPNL